MLDKLIVVDIEATCWEPKDPSKTSEIIEVGICLLDVKSGEISDLQSLLITPVLGEVSEFCTALTTLTAEQLENQLTFAEACDIIKKQYDSYGRCWVSWGDYDRIQFERDCKNKGVKYPFGRQHINAKVLYGIMNKLSKGPGMAKALNREKIPLEGTHHRGVDDAHNIAKLIRTCLQ